MAKAAIKEQRQQIHNRPRMEIERYSSRRLSRATTRPLTEHDWYSVWTVQHRIDTRLSLLLRWRKPTTGETVLNYIQKDDEMPSIMEEDPAEHPDVLYHASSSGG